MTEENKQEQKQDKYRGPQGELGVATAALTIRQKWHEAHFQREDTSDKAHPNRKSFRRLPGAPSLKAFARALAKEGDQVAKDWFANKRGKLNQKRSDANIKAAREAAFATKSAKRKKKGDSGGGAAKKDGK